MHTEANSAEDAHAVEMRFVNALGKATSADMCEALLVQAGVTRALAELIHGGATSLYQESLEEAQSLAAAKREEEEKQAASLLSMLSPRSAASTSEHWKPSRRDRFIAYAKRTMAEMSGDVQVGEASIFSRLPMPSHAFSRLLTPSQVLDAESLNAQMLNANAIVRALRAARIPRSCHLTIC